MTVLVIALPLFAALLWALTQTEWGNEEYE